MMEKRSKRYVGVLMSLVFVLLLTVSALMLGLSSPAKAEGSAPSQAYFLNEDRDTQCLWYNGKHGSKDFAEADRNYGKDGCILFYHWLRVDGQPIKDVETLMDFSHDTKYYKNNERANYNEIPSYITSVEGDPNNGYMNYWINGNGTDIEQAWKKNYPHGELLPVEGGYDADGNLVHYGQGGFGAVADGGANIYTVNVNDDEWHDVSLYVGSSVFHKYPGYDEHTMSIYDLSDNLLAEYVVKDPGQFVYIKFAVKGSYKIVYRTQSFAGAGYNYGLFFDPHTENPEIGTSDFTAKLEGAKTVKLAWTNKSADSTTTIFRREKGSKIWDFLAETGKGVNTYTDESASVSKTYEYALSSGTSKTAEAYYDRFLPVNDKEHFNDIKVNVRYNNIVDEAHVAEVETALYRPTKIEFAEDGYLAEEGTEFAVKVQLLKSDDDGATFVPYPDIEVTLKIEGEAVNSTLGINVYPNMNDTFGKATTDKDGYAEITSSVPFAGEYEMVASIELQPDDATMMTGYDSCSARVGFGIEARPSTNRVVPIITAITDAVKPGDSANIVGFNMADDGELKVAYVKNSGRKPVAFEEVRSYKTLAEEDIIFTDPVNGTGIMFTFPKDEAAGIYDFYVHNANGWSEGFTMNAPRPQFLDQEAAYEGQQIQIVGRNFLMSEYKAATKDEALETLRVKLNLVKDANGNPMSGISQVLSKKNGGILTGLKETKESALQFEIDGKPVLKDGKPVLSAEEIPYTYDLRITIQIPSLPVYGTYEVLVASDGKDYRSLSEPCNLQYVEKKAQVWNETVFGSDKSKVIGKDPLNLGVYWAQDLNYDNVVTMEENTFENAAAYSAELNKKIAALSGNGGGAIYFPEGTYYLYNDIYMKDGVYFVGDGQDKTKLVYANPDSTDTVWFRGTGVSNSGMARLTLCITDERLKNEDGWHAPNFVTNWGGEFSDDIEYMGSTNKFLVDVKGDLQVNGKELASLTTCRQYILICGEKNVLWKNCDFNGGQIYTRCDRYTTVYNVRQVYNGASSSSPPVQGRYSFVENSHIDQNFSGHGLSVRSNTYVAYTYVSRAGDRENRGNQGEALLVEPPSGGFTTGKVLQASERTVTLDAMGGVMLDKNTKLHFNRFAVYISDGTGNGQFRYIERVGEGEFGNRYRLLDSERDWDIIPDTTSVFFVFSPINNLTVSHFKAYDTAGTICLYSHVTDTVVSDCTLVDTAGIGIWGFPVGGLKGARIGMSLNIRIERNDISGVSAHYDKGSNAAQGVGGIYVEYRSQGDYLGLVVGNLIIRDNYLHDLQPEITSYDDHSWTIGTGLTFYSKVTQGQGNPNAARYMIAENNVIEDSEWGIYADRLATGLVLKNNTVTGTTLHPSGMMIYRPTGFVAEGRHELYVNGEKSELSGVYSYESELPEAAADGDKVFFGWTPDENFTADSEIVTKAYGINAKLYAVYGYEVTFDYNYKKSDGSDRGEYLKLKTLAGGNVQAELEENGDPFRLDDEFLGWYADRECTKAFDPSAAVNSNMTVYAKWKSAESGGTDSGKEVPGKKGCGSEICGMTALIACALALTLALKKKRY